MENARIITLAPSGVSSQSISFDQAFGDEYSELRGRGRRRRQKRRMERRKMRQERRMQRIADRAERKRARQAMRAEQQEARQTRKDVRKQRRMARKEMGEEQEPMENGLDTGVSDEMSDQGASQAPSGGDSDAGYDMPTSGGGDFGGGMEAESAPSGGGYEFPEDSAPYDEVGSDYGAGEDSEYLGEYEGFDDYDSMDDYDSADDYEGFDDYDSMDDYDSADDYEGADDYDSMDDYDEFDDYDSLDDYDGFDAYEGADDYDEFDDYESADAMKSVNVDSRVQDLVTKIAWNLELIKRLEKKRRSSRMTPDATQKLSRDIINRKQRVAELQQKLDLFSSADGNPGKMKARRMQVKKALMNVRRMKKRKKPSDARIRMAQAKARRMKQPRPVVGRGLGMGRRGMVTPVKASLNPTFGPNRIIVPAPKGAIVTQAKSSADGVKTTTIKLEEPSTKKAGMKPLTIVAVVAVGIGAIWAINKMMKK